MGPSTSPLRNVAWWLHTYFGPPRLYETAFSHAVIVKFKRTILPDNYLEQIPHLKVSNYSLDYGQRYATSHLHINKIMLLI